MAKQADPSATWRVMILAGVGDIVIGAGMAFAGLTDLIGPDMEILAVVGAVIAVIGVGIVLWGRHKLSQAGDRRGDLN